MERSFSQDIQEGTRELKEAAEQTRNIILDLGLDGKIRWVSPSWTDVVGTALDAVKGRPISDFVADKPDVFTEAIKTLQSDDSKSQFVKFTVKIGPSSELQPMLRDDALYQEAVEKQETPPGPEVLHLEGQGIMVFDRSSGGESHVSWIQRFLKAGFPDYLVDHVDAAASHRNRTSNDCTPSGSCRIAGCWRRGACKSSQHDH